MVDVKWFCNQCVRQPHSLTIHSILYLPTNGLIIQKQRKALVFQFKVFILARLTITQTRCVRWK